MLLTILSAAVSIAASVPHQAADPIHRVTLGHSEFDAVYHTRWTITAREIVTAPSPRAGVTFCRWHAEAKLVRSVTGKGSAPIAALEKPVQAIAPMSGTLAGPCRAAQASIDTEIERELDDNRSTLIAAAHKDGVEMANAAGAVSGRY